MPYGHGVENYSVQFRRKNRQFDPGEGRSPTRMFQQDLLPTSHPLWVYVYTFGQWLMVMIAMAMEIAMEMAMEMAMAMEMVLVMVLVMVIMLPEALRQEGWLRQR